jgi:hypothetical protein
MRGWLGVVVSLAVALCACGSSSGASQRPDDSRLARQVSPKAGDLGSNWRQESAATAHARKGPCALHATSCVWRFFVLPGDPPVIPSATSLAQIFDSVAAAHSAYTRAKRSLSTTRTIDTAGIQQTVALRSEKNLAVGGAHAALLVFVVKETSPIRLTRTSRSILVREGRAELLIALKQDRTIPFAATARRLAARLRPAR